MKKYYITGMLLLFVYTLIGQSKKEIELRTKFWSNENEKLKVVDVPEKWRNESAVILYKEAHYQYRNACLLYTSDAADDTP